MDLMAWSFVVVAAVAFCFGRYVYPRKRKPDFPPNKVVEVADIRDTF